VGANQMFVCSGNPQGISHKIHQLFSTPSRALQLLVYYPWIYQHEYSIIKDPAFYLHIGWSKLSYSTTQLQNKAAFGT
jgi:ABC-type uncharacterized transport system permease subunit